MSDQPLTALASDSCHIAYVIAAFYHVRQMADIRLYLSSPRHRDKDRMFKIDEGL
jgi:hypothetical protein